jgi:uncharacterized SAM-binding protein YcdF (DUF218 family)
MRKLWVVLVLVVVAALILVSTSGSFLVVNQPERADVIVVLAGETDHRPARALELLKDGYAPKLLLDVPANAKIYDTETLDIARAYVNKLPERDAISVCPIVGLSTKTEAQDVAHCLENTGVRRILLVTSDFHTRRARSTFQRELRGREVSVAAAYDPQQFGGSWWEHRQWAKVNFDEWLRLVWWELVDRWRS